MITKRQLAEFARKNHIGQYYQEKDYLQTTFLYAIYRITDKIMLKGGTCLKLAYKYPRFSEDLDFNSTLEPKTLQRIVHRSLKDVALLGMGFSFDKEELFEESYTARIRFKGPRFTGSKASTNAIRLDIGARSSTIQEPGWIQITPEYPDVPTFFLLTMTKEEILAEKLRALSMRSASRDLFDAWCLIQDDVKIDHSLVKAKLDSVGMRFDEDGLKFPKKAEYERDLGNLLPMSSVPNYEQVIGDVTRVIRR
ncbi:MAG: nucleotidyl transferase AbiEii/AbiGii toxin family protein [Methanocellales archaeon]|nr:nucleotidyl transferase AbiEii/AbiGii toxin family protein [Methanocellales archaeon]